MKLFWPRVNHRPTHQQQEQEQAEAEAGKEQKKNPTPKRKEYQKKNPKNWFHKKEHRLIIRNYLEAEE